MYLIGQWNLCMETRSTSRDQVFRSKALYILNELIYLTYTVTYVCLCVCANMFHQIIAKNCVLTKRRKMTRRDRLIGINVVYRSYWTFFSFYHHYLSCEKSLCGLSLWGIVSSLISDNPGKTTRRESIALFFNFISISFLPLRSIILRCALWHPAFLDRLATRMIIKLSGSHFQALDKLHFRRIYEHDISFAAALRTPLFLAPCFTTPFIYYFYINMTLKHYERKYNYEYISW